MVGKNPHRPEGKAKADNERMQAAWMSKGLPYDSGPSEKALAEQDQALIGQPSRIEAEEQVGGSRPGVPSRVKEALDRIEDRQE
jgi:hypothetical protein